MAETATASPRAGAGPLDQDELDRLLDNPLLRPGSPPPAEAATDPQRGQPA
jgi:hypothetical protein